LEQLALKELKVKQHFGTAGIEGVKSKAVFYCHLFANKYPKVTACV